MVRKKGSTPPNLGDQFAGAHPEAAVIIPCISNASVVAKGHIFVIENDRILPTDSDKTFGYEPAVFEKLPVPVQSRVKANFIAEQTELYEQAQAKTILTYEDQLAAVRENIMVELQGDADLSIETEIAMVMDPVRADTIKAAIESGKSAAAAIDEAYETEIQTFSAMDDPYFAKMTNELMQHRATLQHHLHPDKTVATYDQVQQGAIVLANEGIPLAAVVGLIDKDTGKPTVSAIATTKGSLTSHAAIVARSLGIPYIRIEESDSRHLKNNEICIVDGANGRLLVQPSRAASEAFDEKIQAQKDARHALDHRWHGKKSSVTLDGEKVNVHANVGVSIEAPSVRAANPAGIGLLRTEIAESMRTQETTPEKWYEIFENNMRACAQRDGQYLGMTIRTLDTAGDKGNNRTAEEQKEYEEPIIAAQMLAILRLNRDLSEKGHKNKIKVMIPMIGSSEDLEAMQCKFNAIAEENDLPNMKLGTMVEVPSVLDQLGHLDAEFFSVGSNDMICSLLGINRYESESMKKYDPTNLTVLKALETVTTAGEARSIPVSICGDIASQAKYMAMLVGAGFRNMSSGIDNISMNKEVLSRIDTQEARTLFQKLKTIETRVEREALLAEFNACRLGLKKDGTLDVTWQKPESPSVSLDIP